MNKSRTSTANQHGGARETTPLMANGSGPGANRPYEHNSAYNFFLNKNWTPGVDSPKPWVKAPANVWHILKATLLSNYVNVFLVFVPIGIVAGSTGWDPVTANRLRDFS